MQLPPLLTLGLAGLATAGGWRGGHHHRPPPHGNGKGQWRLSQFQSFIPFGDSYTDESRLNYFGSHNGQAPPPGTVLPESSNTAVGGRVWARYVAQYAGSKSKNGTWDPKLALYNYAVSGSVCSNELTPRTYLPGIIDFPSVHEYELPAFEQDLKAINPATGKPTFQPPLSPQNTVFSIWIGTNDLGVDAFFTDSQVPGTDIVDYLDCVYDVLDGLYSKGARYFVIMNAAPLNLAPLYANATEGGNDPEASAGYWPDKPSNLTAIGAKMAEYVALVNDAYETRTPYFKLIQNRYQGANMAVYNVHKLMYDIHQNPNKFLNGTSKPYNTSQFIHHCSDTNNQMCTDNPSPDSFMWYDALHPSEQTSRVVAREFINLLDGNSSYATYW